MAEIDVVVTEKKISISELVAAFHQGKAHGGSNIFSGMVREINFGKKVISVSYDAFIPLAEKTLRLICEEAASKFENDLKVKVVHRIGKLSVGETSVVIIVYTKHRDEAFKACRYIIEELKIRVPIWKKEQYEDGETEWLRGHALCSHQNHHEG